MGVTIQINSVEALERLIGNDIDRLKLLIRRYPFLKKKEVLDIIVNITR